MDSLVYGSVARGDVGPASDVDIVLLGDVPSFKVEMALEAGFHVLERRITIASPNSVPKATIALEDDTNVSWPLLPPSEREEEFYRFGGAIDAGATGPRERVPGVTKSLILVEPVEVGHVETSVLGVVVDDAAQIARGLEVDVARRMGLPVEVVMERVRVLTRRDAIGRTGVFRSVGVEDGMTFEQTLEAMADTTPAVRRQFRYRKEGR